MFVLVDFSGDGADAGFEQILIFRRQYVRYDGVGALFLTPENDIISYTYIHTYIKHHMYIIHKFKRNDCMDETINKFYVM